VNCSCYPKKFARPFGLRLPLPFFPLCPLTQACSFFFSQKTFFSERLSPSGLKSSFPLCFFFFAQICFVFSLSPRICVKLFFPLAFDVPTFFQNGQLTPVFFLKCRQIHLFFTLHLFFPQVFFPSATHFLPLHFCPRAHPDQEIPSREDD